MINDKEFGATGSSKSGADRSSIALPHSFLDATIHISGLEVVRVVVRSGSISVREPWGTVFEELL